MHSYSFSFLHLFSTASLLVGHALMVAIAILLLKERGIAPKIILTGALLHVGSGVVQSFPNQINPLIQGSNSFPMFWIAFVSASSGGRILFFAGLLLFVLQRRALRRRNEELESILETQLERIPQATLPPTSRG